MSNPSHQSATLRPWHITSFEYPCPEISDAAPEQFEWHSVQGSKERYEPLPLIADPAVVHHAFRGEDEKESRIINITEASIEPRDIEAGMPALADPIFRLANDIQFIESCSGGTSLLIDTNKIPNCSSNCKAVSVVRVRRWTTFCFRDARHVDEATYDIGLHSMLALENYFNKSWLHNILDLILGRTDQAVLHVASSLSIRGIEAREIEWKSQRQPPYEEVMARRNWAVESSRTRQEDMPECAICRESTSTGETVSNCPGKHVYHRDCLLHVCYAAGPEDAKCPLCRARLFTDETDLNFLKFGVVDKAYLNDDRFNSWENFERSCADIDKHLAENDNREVTCNSRLMSIIYNHLIDGASQEPHSSTPIYLQLINHPHFPLFQQTLVRAMERMHGRTMRVRDVYEALLTHVQATFMEIILTSEVSLAMKNTEIKKLRNDPAAARAGVLRSPFKQFVQRTLSRLLEFLYLRDCRCTMGATHWHGGRAYFNMGCEEWSGSRTMFPKHPR